MSTLDCTRHSGGRDSVSIAVSATADIYEEGKDGGEGMGRKYNKFWLIEGEEQMTGTLLVYVYYCYTPRVVLKSFLILIMYFLSVVLTVCVLWWLLYQLKKSIDPRRLRLMTYCGWASAWRTALGRALSAP